MKKFEGKTVIVTGGGKNIGRQISLDFASEGANVVVCDYNEENANQTVAEIEAMGCSAMAAVCDVRDRKKVFEYVDAAIEKYGKIDVLVNNAGGSAMLLKKLSKFVDAEPETIDFVIDTNIKGTMNFIQAVLKPMIEQKSGKIINMSSIAAVCGLERRVDYSAAKAALIGMTKSLAIEVGRYEICVNCVSPGSIARNGKYNDHMTYLGENGRSGSPKDISDTVLFLASQDYITGQNFIIDGGRTLGPGPR